ncbi:hypothetical protein BHM03_00023853 [Ensete ventricosum]|uniref:Uncharacterized protein n=1 Tax=Ensete ventricosum TaxID=4639 RepID=A0A445MGT6_ENSVE|nr:hypothetical protein BHM03_00023853 [Ensete ventricosum]
MHQVDAVGNLPGVRRKLVEGIGSLLGWCKGVRQKKIETRWKIVEGSRKAYREFVEGIGKLAKNTKGDCQEEDWRTCRKITGGCRIMRKFGLI